MKKALSLILVLVMCLSLMPLTLTAMAAAYLKLDKSNYNSGDLMILTVSGITAQMEENLAWVGIYKVNASYNDYSDYKTVWEGTWEYEFYAPAENGQYEFRLFKSEGSNAAAVIATIKFAVGKTDSGGTVSDVPANSNKWIKIPKSNYDPVEAMHIEVHGLTEQMFDSYDYHLLIYKKGAAANDDPVDGTFLMPDPINYPDINAPAESGEYELRLYSMNDDTAAKVALIASVPFTVGKLAKDGNISLDKKAYAAFEPIIVTVTGITRQMVNSRATVVIYQARRKAPTFMYGDISR